jgi:hypothetical protein
MNWTLKTLVIFIKILIYKYYINIMVLHTRAYKHTVFLEIQNVLRIDNYP